MMQELDAYESGSFTGAGPYQGVLVWYAALQEWVPLSAYTEAPGPLIARFLGFHDGARHYTMELAAETLYARYVRRNGTLEYVTVHLGSRSERFASLEKATAWAQRIQPTP